MKSRSGSDELSMRRAGVGLAACTAVISGVSVFINGYGVRAWAEISDATTYTTLKNSAAALVLVVAALIARRSPGRPTPDPQIPIRQRGPALALVALVGGSLPFVLFFEGLAVASSADAAFIHKTLVLWVAILAVVFLHEKVGIPHLGAIALLLLGQAALSGGVEAFALGPGEWMILGATMLWAVETVVARRVLASTPASTLAVARMAGGAALLMGYGIWRGGLGPLTGVTAGHVMWIVITGLILSAYVATWYAALARAPAVDVTAVLVAGAIVTALLESGLGGAEFPPVAGLVLVGAGVVLFATRWPRLTTVQ